jgi:hypothetical protein
MISVMKELSPAVVLVSFVALGREHVSCSRPSPARPCT